MVVKHQFDQDCVRISLTRPGHLRFHTASKRSFPHENRARFLRHSQKKPPSAAEWCSTIALVVHAPVILLGAKLATLCLLSQPDSYLVRSNSNMTTGVFALIECFRPACM